MKKHIILPILAAMVAGTISLNAGNIKIKAIDETPTKATELSNKAFWCMILNFTNEDSLKYAVSLCDQAIALDPDLIDAYFNRADARYFMGDYANALKDFDITVEKRGHADDFQYRGECKYNLNDFEGALADFTKAADLGESSTESGASLAMKDANVLGIAFYNANNYDKAVTAFKISVNATTTGTNLYNLANSEYLAGDHSTAINDWHRSMKMGDKDAKKAYKKYRKT
ncbi:MAG: tetratricopeptide repeat protein [Bacteroidetes bacterium]|nr:tetratricopeptide repeat protein [Bacteroidota bacterium]